MKCEKRVEMVSLKIEVYYGKTKKVRNYIKSYCIQKEKRKVFVNISRKVMFRKY